MTKVTNLLIILLLSSPLLGQKVGKDAVNMNNCAGAINVFENGQFSMQFTGKAGNKLEQYNALATMDSENILWVSFIADKTGALNFQASIPSGYLQMVIFEAYDDDICSNIDNGYAEIQRMFVKKDFATIGLGDPSLEGFMSSMHMEVGQKIQICFAAPAKSDEILSLDWFFDPDVHVETETKTVDRRDDDFAPSLYFKIRDKESGDPLIAGLTIVGQRDLDGHYTGSDLYFNIHRRLELEILCDLEGYFFHDSLYTINSGGNVEIEIILDRVSSGKSIQIEEIQFIPGTSEILKSSEPKLRRIKDFLALNAELEVEIQGHVFAVGENSIAAQKVSEARARRVMKYLIENGISKKRLTAVGYGNTRPVYADPTRTYQEQANRRVEIMVL